MIRLAFGVAIALAAWTGTADAQGTQPIHSFDPAGQPGDALPADFHGKVRYFGNHSGQLVSVARSGERPRRARQDCPRPDQGCPVRLGGSLEVELEFEGEVVRGTFNGTGGLQNSGLIGRRQGSQCRLFDLTDGSVWAGRCDREAFLGTVISVPNAAEQIELAFETVGTRTIDYAERERLRREAIQRSRRIELLQNILSGGAPLERRFEAAVELDSYSWRYETLVPGSISNVVTTRERNGRREVSGDFALESGGAGWARAQVENGAIVCVEFWDFPGNCRPINPPPPIELPPENDTAERSLLISTRASERIAPSPAG